MCSLGLIARISKIPYIRDMCFIEMIARAFKYVFRNRTRNALLHFRAVGATSIDDQLKDYTATMFNTVLGRSEKAEKVNISGILCIYLNYSWLIFSPSSLQFWYDKLEKEIYRKFEFDMEFSSFASLHRPALFMALQYHVRRKKEGERGG